MSQDLLNLINKILEPKRLSYLQELVLRQSLAGKPYREIAIQAGYDFDYVKEVGAQVWQSLSEALGEKVTKKNVKLVLAGRYDLGAASGGTALGYSTVATVSADTLNLTEWGATESNNEIPSESVPLHSTFYINRPPIEEQVFAELTRPGSLVRIKAPRQMGKTSLVLRAIAYARQQGFHTVTLNFQQADGDIFTDLRRFLRWFCTYVSRQANLSPNLEQYWDDDIGSKVSCTIYFQEYLLKQLDSPFVLALDEVNRIFEYPDLAQEFLPLMRSWHESVEHESWQKLRLLIIHSTEIYIPLQLSQSPFNVGLPIQLPELTRSQVEDLAQRYGLLPSPQAPAAENSVLKDGLLENGLLETTVLKSSDLDDLNNLVGGHPYLVRLALHWIQQNQTAMAASGQGGIAPLLEEAPTQSGLYRSHLRHLLSLLQEQPPLWEAFQQVIADPNAKSVQLEAIAAYQLESLGLIKLKGNEVIPSCELYRLYFGTQMQESLLTRL
jgi:AAA-like domain